MKILKIISTVCKPRTVRENTTLEGEPLLYCVGSQNFVKDEDIKKLIIFNIEYENKINPGVNQDVAIINNNVNNKSFNKFLDRFSNNRTNWGKIKVVHRSSNAGWSYGSFSYGFDLFKDYYDYFIFIEDDTIFDRPYYTYDAIKKFESTNKCGFVSIVGINQKSYFNLNKNQSFCAHNGIGLTSKKILMHVKKNNKHLPYCDEIKSNNYENIIKYGEIEFTNIIHRLGYNLVNIDENIKYFNFAYDLMRNLKVPKKPGYIRRTLIDLKFKIKKYKSILANFKK